MSLNSIGSLNLYYLNTLLRYFYIIKYEWVHNITICNLSKLKFNRYN